MIFNLAEMTGQTILSGAPSGRHLYSLLVSALPAEPEMPAPLLLDFRTVEVATASYLRESVLAFRNFVRTRKSKYYPVVANVSDEIVDELLEVAQSRGDVVMACWSDAHGTILRWRPLGKLDPMQQLTFDLVMQNGETTASRLAEVDESAVKTTAWNNRLASLSNLGLVGEYSRGRAKFYKPLFRGDLRGS